MILVDFYKVIKARRSIRKFTSEPISEDILERILNSARLAPTWANMQGCRYIIVDDKENVNKLKKAINQKWLKTVHLFLVICIQERRSGKNPNGIKYFTVDAAICMEHLILAATNEGLGSCWIGYFNEKDVKNALDIPKRERVIGITPLGYPATKPKEQERKDLGKIVYKNRYGNNWDL
ncbi:MAG: nitroreductase [Candidatus Lokiarchaeota archaeon]|nr:nitroreductase [Candidatus Lokiarchaeota archaeon]